MPGNRERRQIFWDDIRYMCPVHVTLSCPSLAVLCDCTGTNLAFKGPLQDRNKLGMERECPGAGIAEHCISCLEYYTSPFSSLEQITTFMCCLCP